MSRLTLFAAIVTAIALSTVSTNAMAQQTGLPDMGSSAGELLSPHEEAMYGAYTLYELRRRGYVLEDALIDDWISNLGQRLAAVSDRPEQDFTFFMMRDRQINAFATLGGYIGANAGLALNAETEDEIAGVLAHEIAHVSQRHMLRAAERAKKDQLPIMIATLGMIIAAQSKNSNDTSNNNHDSGDAIQAAVISGQALAAQRRINYTRSSEAEADRIGIQTLYRAGYNVNGLADFFERMDRLSRGNSGGYRLPDYLQSHPVTTTRMSEARERAERLLREPPITPTATTISNSSLLLPASLSSTRALSTTQAPLHMFSWARERLRVLSADSPLAAYKEYQKLISAEKKNNAPLRYGLALSQIQAGYPAAAEMELEKLTKQYPDNLWVGIALAETAHAAKNETLARERYETLLKRFPNDRAISLSYAEALNSLSTAEAGRRSQSVLRPLLGSSAENPLFQKLFGRASELSGDLPRAGEAYAEAAYLNGRTEDALNQLSAILKRQDIDYIQRARIEARIAAITPEVLEMRRRGLKPQDQGTDRN